MLILEVSGHDVLHENEAWTAPLEVELARLGLPYELWFLDEGHLDLARPPPEGVFYNRMSASAHTRDHRYGPEYTACLLAWGNGAFQPCATSKPSDYAVPTGLPRCL